MSGGWVGSTGRKRTSTSAWQRLRAQVLERDGRRCHLCGGVDADAVDHLVPVSQGGGDELSNLAAVHDRVWPNCHRKKTAREAAAARTTTRRPPERHPGLLPPA
ncbi:HNH endonuclease [Kineococcus sp. SYSU DK001]|uniref:HNH endonuclease n=1 Tax=Kineococcus sp. SYSU DK001 TaxID=3383122 RepID=UPI003D7E6E94